MKNKEEDIVKEYIAAMKYHVGQGQFVKKDMDKVHREVCKYIKLEVKK